MHIEHQIVDFGQAKIAVAKAAYGGNVLIVWDYVHPIQPVRWDKLDEWFARPDEFVEAQ